MICIKMSDTIIFARQGMGFESMKMQIANPSKNSKKISSI